MRRIAMALFLLCAAAAAQITVEGDVVRNSTGEPIAGVRVAAPCGQSSWTATDAVGHFRCVSPPDFAGRSMMLTFDAPGFLPRKQLITMDPQTSVYNVRVAMTAQAAISGMVVDEIGWPIRATVTAVQYVNMENGGRRMVPVRRVPTDDLGAYRIGKLPPGRYYIRVRPPDVAPWSDYLPAWYPSAALPADARAIDLREGQEVSGMDIPLTPGGGVSIRGRVILPDGYQPSQGYLSIAWEELGSTTVPGTQAPIAPDGSFTIRHVAPGRYTLLATTSTFWDESVPQRYSALRPVEVGGENIDGIALNVAPTPLRDLRGTVVCEGGVRPEQVHITLGRSFANVRLQAKVAADGSFVIPGVWPGQYRGNAYADGGYASSMQWGGRNISNEVFDFDGTEAPLQVTIRPEGSLGHISGTVKDAKGGPVSGGSVILVAAGGTYVASPYGSRSPVGTDQHGAFTVSRVPAGVYRAYVVKDPAEVDAAMNDAEFLKQQEKAFPPLTVAAGENAAVRLVLPES
jgi:hypothetical protein